MKIISEGKARIKIFDGVFYNPLAAFSRTFGVVAVSAFSRFRGKDLIVADGMAATGIRGIRYYLEGRGIDKIIFNDRSVRAYENIKQNVTINKIPSYEVYNYDVNLFHEMICKSYCDVIDLDPFGSPSSFLDSLIRSVRHGGMIVVTATDLTALCGIYPSAAFRKYFTYLYKSDFCHEVALRVLIKELVVAGGRNNRYVYPLISIFTEQYARIYAYVVSAKRVSKENIGYIYENMDGFRITLSPYDIKSKNFIGPIWIGPLHDVNFIQYMKKMAGEIKVGEKDTKRIIKILTLMEKEASLPPYAYKISRLSSKLKVSQPKINDLIEMLESSGYRAGRSHMGKDLLKTDAPIYVVEDFLVNMGRK